jgi:glycine/D-amino acid oxidase-like deaminating enzyme
LKSGTVIEGDVFVLANGVRLGEATAALQKPMIVRPFKLEWIRLKLSEQLPNFRLGAAEVTFIPKPDGTTIVGNGPLSGNMGVPQEDGSVKPGTPLDYDWQDNHNDLPTDKILERFTEAAVTVLPRVETADMTEHTAGLLTWLPGDSLGTMGPLPGFDNAYVATTEIGIMLSLSMGRLLSELVLNGKTEDDIGIFSPEKYLK